MGTLCGTKIGPNLHTRGPCVNLDFKIEMGVSWNPRIHMPYDSMVGDTWEPSLTQKWTQISIHVIDRCGSPFRNGRIRKLWNTYAVWYDGQCYNGTLYGFKNGPKSPYALAIDGFEIGMGVSGNLRIHLPYDSLVDDTWGLYLAQTFAQFCIHVGLTLD